MENINKLIANGTSTAKELESMIGRLGHLRWLCRESIISSVVSENSSNWPPTDVRFESTRPVGMT
jgi:hypothetical protein